MEKENPFVEKKNTPGPRHDPKQGDSGPNKPPADQLKRMPGEPGERSDKESIGRPVQLDKDPQKPRRPAEGHEDDRARNEPAGV